MPDDDPRELVARAVESLAAASARTEALARYVPPRRVLGFPRDARMEPIGRVWRLGVFLLGADGALYAVGSVTRATPPGHPGHQSESAEVRREYRAAANRSRFAPGETVNYDARPIDLEPGALAGARGPLFTVEGRALVRWSASVPDSAATPFSDYLAERVELLSHPPQGAT